MGSELREAARGPAVAMTTVVVDDDGAAVGVAVVVGVEGVAAE